MLHHSWGWRLAWWRLGTPHLKPGRLHKGHTQRAVRRGDGPPAGQKVRKTAAEIEVFACSSGAKAPESYRVMASQAPSKRALARADRVVLIGPSFGSGSSIIMFYSFCFHLHDLLAMIKVVSILDHFPFGYDQGSIHYYQSDNAITFRNHLRSNRAKSLPT